MRNLVVAIVVLCGGLQAAAQQSGRLKMWADRAVSRAEVPGAVVVYLQNASWVPLQTSLPWRVVRDGQTVASFPSSTVQTVLGWEVRPFVWNKKDRSGKWVKSGSYTIEVGPIALGSGKWERPAVTVAVTGTGWIAAGSWFPLTKGNLWRFRGPGGEIEFQRVEQEWIGWVYLRNAPAGNGWVSYDGYPTPRQLFAYEGRSRLLFWFRTYEGATWEPGFSTIKKLRVGAVGASIVTWVGGFTKVDRIDVLESAGQAWKYGSFWFADGVGMIAYTKVTPSGTKTYRLWEAVIRAPESKRWYTLRGY